jgi:GAF domain-containing protein
MERLWQRAVEDTLQRVRAANPNLDADLPDSVVVTEAAHHFDPPSLWPVEQWFLHRLSGRADTARQREALAENLRQQAAQRPSQRVPWGFVTGTKSRLRSRRGDPPRRPPA